GVERQGEEALRSGSVRLSWGELRSNVLSVAGHLRPILASGGGRIALLGGASAELVVAYLATIAAGGCAVPLPVSAHRDALAGMLTDCEPDLIIAHEDALSMLDGIANAPVVSVRPGKGMPEELIAASLEAPV